MSMYVHPSTLVTSTYQTSADQSSGTRWYLRSSQGLLCQDSSRQERHGPWSRFCSVSIYVISLPAPTLTIVSCSFESRNACEEVVKQFNNHPIPSHGEEHMIQIRYADSQEQKQLKQQTAAARQFRSAEYEYATQAHKQGAYMGGGRLSPYSALSYENINPANEFETYLGTPSE